MCSLQATSAAFRAGSSPDPGTKAGGAAACLAAASASSCACNAGSARASWSGDARRGTSTRLRSTISAQATRSCVRSTAGGTEVSDAAAKKMLNPMPISTSANRRIRSTGVAGSRRNRSTTRKLPSPSNSSAPNIAAFAVTITPYAVPYTAPQAPTYSRLNTVADTRMQATPTMLMRENRAPTRRNAAPSRSRPSAITKHGIPPTHTAAPRMCSALAANSTPSPDSRATACVVMAAATTTTATRPSSGAAGTGRRVNRHPASTAAAPIFTSPATAKPAPSTPRIGSPSVSISTADCIATVSSSHATSATALQPAITAVRRASPAPSGNDGCNGRAKNTRNSAPPSAMLCATMVMPCRTMDR